METMYPGKVNSPATLLDGGINDSAETIDVIDGSVLPDSPNLAVIGTGEDAETILYGTKIANQLTNVTRGHQGSAKAWDSGETIARMFTELDYANLKANIETHETDKVGSASNLGNGAEVFKQKTGVDLEFRKIKAGSNKIDIVWYDEEGYVLTEEYSGDLTGPENIFSANWWAQTFTTTSAYNVKKIELWVKKLGSPVGDLHIAIKATSGGKPIGEDLVSVIVSKGDISSSYSWVEGIFDTSYSLDDDTLYAIVVTSPNSVNSSNCFQWTLKSDNPYGGGTVCSSTNSGSDWSILSNFDFLFKVYKTELVYKNQIEIDLIEANIKGGLLSTKIIDFNADADTNLYTVPTGKRCILTHAIVVAAGDAGATTTVSIGADGAETDFIPANTLSNLDAEYDAVILMPIPNTIPLRVKSYAADTVIEARVATQSGVEGNTIYLFGILY